MKAVEFVKKFGWEEAKRVLINAPFGYPEIVVDDEGVSYGVGLTPLVGGLHFTYEELKQLIEAKELVDSFGGLKRAKRILKKSYMSFNTRVSVVWNDKPFQCDMDELEKAIQLVESVNA